MNALTAVASRTFPAKTLRVHAPVCLEIEGTGALELELALDALVDLDFGVQVRRTFRISDVPLASASEETDASVLDRAKHCLVVLVGGKNLVIRPDPSLRERWHLMPSIPARVYLRDRVLGKPVGYIESMAEAGGPALEVGPFMAWLAGEGFEVDLVREALNGGA